MQITSRSTPDETLTRLCSLRQQKRYLHVRDFVLLVAIHPAVTEMTKSPLSGVGGRWRMMECVYASGFLTHFIPHSNSAPQLYKRMAAFLYGPTL